jgi:hypothetical protein
VLEMSADGLFVFFPLPAVMAFLSHGYRRRYSQLKARSARARASATDSRIRPSIHECPRRPIRGDGNSGLRTSAHRTSSRASRR